MKPVVGIIAEYNPFHNGHAYQINQAKEITGADYAVIILSGNFVQRGEPAMVDKHTRTQMALSCGADLVIELPVCYATASADYFASAAIAILDRLGVVTHLCFGSECGNIASLEHVADLLLEEPAAFSLALQEAQKNGASYPQALAVAAFMVDDTISAGLLSSPNNLLGISYIKALKGRNSTIIPVTIKREGQHYNDTTHDNTQIGKAYFASAASIRSQFNQQDLSDLAREIPACALSILEETTSRIPFMRADDLSPYLAYALLTKTPIDYLDISVDLANRIKKLRPQYHTFTQFAALLKNKSNTAAGISRALLHMVLDIKKYDIECYSTWDWVEAVRILGFRKSAASLLTAIKKSSTVTCISKVADYKSYTANLTIASTQLEQTLFADDVYRMMQMSKVTQDLPAEFSIPISIR
jgi:predicted nucleotidyltransferase